VVILILITLGTQDKPFDRLLDAVQKQIDNKKIKDRVVVQTGHTKYESEDMELFDFISSDDFSKLMDEAKIIITHAGVGSILAGVNRKKPVIAAARLKEHGEHTNNHQLEILEQFSNDGYILKLDDFDKLDKLLVKAKKFVPEKYKSNNKYFIKKLSEYIDNL